MRYSTQAADTMIDALTALLDGGTIKICDARGDILARPRLGTPAFAPAIGGSATAHDIHSEMHAKAGTATSFRLTQSDGTDVVSGPVAQLHLTTTEITPGAKVEITSLEITA